MGRKLMAGALVVLFNGLATATATADVDRQALSHLTFTRAVQLPGVLLPEGTYTFDRVAMNVVRVRSADHKVVYGMFMTLPTLRAKHLTTTEVVFGEAAAGQAPPLKVWYPFPVTEWSSNHHGLGYGFLY